MEKFLFRISVDNPIISDLKQNLIRKKWNTLFFSHWISTGTEASHYVRFGQTGIWTLHRS